MKSLLAVIFAAVFVGCAQTGGGGDDVVVANRHDPYERYSTNPVTTGPTTAYASWTTEHLQKQRLKLYAMVPRNVSKHGVPEYEYRGTPLPQQDEIKAIEAELNKRYAKGDKAAKLE